MGDVKEEIRAAIHENMMRSDNPFDKVNPSIWKINKNKYMTADKFNQQYDINKSELRLIGDQYKIYWLWENESKCRCLTMKEYDVSKGSDALNKVFTEYVFINKTRLQQYRQFFYDQQRKVVMIIYETLNYSLGNFVVKHIYPTIASNYKAYTLIKNESICKNIMLDILNRLWIMHRCGFIHCNLWIHNIMFRTDRNYGSRPACWNIINFESMLKIKDANINTYKWRGKIYWTAPEIDINSKNNKYSTAVDIWGFGLLILFTLFCKHPYQMSTYEVSLCKNRKDQMEYFYYNKLLRYQNSPKIESFNQKMQNVTSKKKTGKLHNYSMQKLQRKRIIKKESQRK